jgi:type I restriction enzyme S subunit
MLNISVGATMPSLNTELIDNIPLYLPPLDYQNKAASILDVIDEKILLNNKVNSELEALARTLYDYWFVQFDFPDGSGRPYKSAGGAMVFNPVLNRHIPKGWEVKKLKELVKINKRKAEPNADLRLIDLSIMPSGTICLNQSSAGDSFATNMLDMRKYDILFGSIRPYLLKAGFAPFDGLVAGTIHSFSPLEKSNTNFLLLAMTSKSIFDHAITSSKGTKMPVIGAGDLLDYLVPYSPKVMTAFEEAISFKEIIATNIEESMRLAMLRDFLLPMLMNGQMSVD